MSPFSTRQSASPSGFHPASDEPLNVQSGMKLPLAPATGSPPASVSTRTHAATIRLVTQPPADIARTLRRGNLASQRELSQQRLDFACAFYTALSTVSRRTWRSGRTHGCGTLSPHAQLPGEKGVLIDQCLRRPGIRRLAVVG